MITITKDDITESMGEVGGHMFWLPKINYFVTIWRKFGYHLVNVWSQNPSMSSILDIFVRVCALHGARMQVCSGSAGH